MLFFYWIFLLNIPPPGQRSRPGPRSLAPPRTPGQAPQLAAQADCVHDCQAGVNDDGLTQFYHYHYSSLVLAHVKIESFGSVKFRISLQPTVWSLRGRVGLHELPSIIEVPDLPPLLGNHPESFHPHLSLKAPCLFIITNSSKTFLDQ